MICSEEVFVIKKVKNTVPWRYVISELIREEINGTFHEKEFQKTNQKEFEASKVINKKAISYLLYGKAMVFLLVVGLIKKT